MLERLFPRQVDNRFDGYRAALWLMGLLVALKLWRPAHRTLHPSPAPQCFIRGNVVSGEEKASILEWAPRQSTW